MRGMSERELPVLDTSALRELARQGGRGCAACVAIKAPGWEALPGGFDASALLRKLATLRPPGVDDPTLEEFHPAGTRSWSPDAPIAPAWFPYNRCDVWECKACRRPFLRYTEYGGYYVEERIRELDPAKIAD
jgi:hypothetical protein